MVERQNAGWRWWWVALVLPIVVASGCSTDAALPVREALADAPQRKTPFSYRVAVAPLSITDKAPNHPTVTYVYRRATARFLESLRPAVMAALEHTRAFEELTFLEAFEEYESFQLIDPDEPAPQAPKDSQDGSAKAAGKIEKASAAPRRAYTYPEPPSDVEFGKAAAAAGCDLVLKLSLRDHAVSFDRINGNVAPSMIMLMLFWFPAYWIADETFVGNVDLELSLHKPGERRAIWRERVKVHARVELDDWDRGFTLLSTIGIPDWLDDGNYDDAAEHAMPHAHNAVALKVAEAFAELESLPR